jgi:hypothetical protein
VDPAVACAPVLVVRDGARDGAQRLLPFGDSMTESLRSAIVSAALGYAMWGVVLGACAIGSLFLVGRVLGDRGFVRDVLRGVRGAFR